MWSAAIEAILTTLRYLAPATLLTLFWGQQSFLFKLLKHIDSTFRAIVFSSEEQKQDVLKWIAEAGIVRVEHLDTVWRHGWILCGVLDAALPGACAGHPPTRLSLKHAQAIADHYLGVEPVFSRQELESNDSLSRHQEWKLATYLDRIREALSKIPPPVSKPSSQRTSPETTHVTLDYVARGSGLTAAQINNKMYFKIYPTAQQSLDPGEITILIRGPKDTYGMIVLQPILGKAQIIQQKLLGLQSKTNYTENVLPITQGATYLRTFGKNDMNKTYFIPKTKYDIEIDVEVRSDHARIGYTVRIEGKYEISITSRGQSIVGSPFKMIASKNIIDILERESFCLEDGEEIDIVDVKTDRKVVLRIVDFVTEKMLLKENGCLEKISDNEAKILMTADNVENELSKIDSQSCKVSSTTSEEQCQSISEKFKKTVDKIIKMNRICKVFNNLTTIKKLEVPTKQKSYIQTRRQKDIPDIVNSTLSEVNIKPYILPEKRDKYIIPESISVSLRIEKPISSYEEINKNRVIVDVDNTNKQIKSTFSEHLEVSPIIELEEDIISVGQITSSNNPFYNDFFEENNRVEKDLGIFINTEYETNNSQNEEMEDMPIKILLENTPSPIGSNPFTNIDYVNLERPKTPVLKILRDEVKNREDSVYVDSKSGLIPEETLSNEFINPFFMHQHMQSNPIADFIIGAPVSLPPILRAPSPDPDMESILITTKNLYSLEMDKNEQKKGKRPSEFSRFHYSTPLHKNISKGNEISKPDKSVLSSTSHSLESNYTDELNLSTSSDNHLESFDKIETLQSDRNITSRKDTWDSAYVSIDDNASSPDNNSNENNVQAELSSKQNMSHNDGNNGLSIEELSNMGPAEREIWQTCNELNDTTKQSEEIKLHKLDVKRPIFTPIIEETDRSLSSIMKETKGSEIIPKYEIDSVTEAFAELNDLYQGYFPDGKNSSTILISDDANKLQNIEIDNIKTKNDHVDSASEDLSDMKRRAKKMEGTISEVQPNVTESISVSRTLHDNIKDLEDQVDKYDVDNKVEMQFGNERNIVLERKKYWDERIRQIHAKSEETKLQHKKKRTSYKYLKANDSLTKRKGKQIVKHFLGVGEHQQATQNKAINNDSDIVKHTSTSPQISVEEVHDDVKLVEKWKKYWDDKLETERDETDAMYLKTNKNITKPKEHLTPLRVTSSTENIRERNKNTNDPKSKSQSLSVKQDLPEEVFKAFETSPKRFFGTSRKQILNKIDAFLGKPNTVDTSSIDTSNVSYDTGLVSSRISLFHNISQTEELPCKRRKTRSPHNIYQKEDHKETINRDIDRLNKSTEINEAETSQTIINKPGKTETGIKTKKPIIEDISERQTRSILLKDKRARMTENRNTKSLDDRVCHILEIETSPIKQNLYVKKTKHEYNKQSQHHEKYKKTLHKTSISKSEMDIFNKTTSDENNLDKYKSCDELPKINVKSFISLYENVSKSVADFKPIRIVSRTNSISSQRSLLSISSSLGAETQHEASQHSTPSKQTNTSVSINNQPKSDSPQPPPRKKRWLNKKSESKSTKSTDTEASFDFSEIEIISQDSGKETTYLSLSDIELEIIENIPQKSHDSSPERNVVSADMDYKTRFKRAKEYFQSLEELRDVKKPKKLNECEMLLYNKSTESLENDRPQKRLKKKIKSHTMPSSEIFKIWNQIKENKNNESGEHKYVKISEKFNVEDLFSDVMEGRLSRQGSLRGIPHKKAVLETFKSMENISDGNPSPYEIAATQLSDFAKENKIKTAQTYLSEYPYLPTTDPSKYHSRLDVKASGLISLKELLRDKRRRNSVPDLRLNPKFTADL